MMETVALIAVATCIGLGVSAAAFMGIEGWLRRDLRSWPDIALLGVVTVNCAVVGPLAWAIVREAYRREETDDVPCD